MDIALFSNIDDNRRPFGGQAVRCWEFDYAFEATGKKLDDQRANRDR